jgi:mono/diheme cytochrome c family protein
MGLTAPPSAAAPPPPVLASTTHSDSYLPAFAFDGNPETRWASGVSSGQPDWVQVDLGKPCKQSGIVIEWEAAFARSYEVQLSDDGATWRTVFVQKKGERGKQPCPFAEQIARYVRVLCLEPGPHPLSSIFEITLTHPEAQSALAAIQQRLAAAERAQDQALPDALKNNGVKEIVFALRKFHTDGHWYANIGYYAVDPNSKLFQPFGQLCKLDTTTGKTTLLLDDPQGGVRDPAIDYDARKVLFSYRKGGTDCYNLYEINLDGSGLKQLTDGPRDDIEASYLPDGGIVFVSTRGNRWVNCWASQVATLHRCDADGKNIRQLSANLEHDNTPAVLPNGQLLYQRWEYVDRSQVDYHHLWTMNADGTGQMVYYGNQRPPGVYIDARPIPGSDDVLMINSPGHGGLEHAGHVALITNRYGPDEPTALRNVTAGGNFRDPYPLDPNHYLVARDTRILCQNLKGRSVELYRVPEELAKQGVQANEPRPVLKRQREPVAASRVEPSRSNGTLLLANAYLGRNMGGVPAGSIKSLLVMECLPKPINFTGGMDPLTYGGSFTLERILGTVPVEEDGSANFEVPANRALFLIALDAQGHSVKRMQSFLTVMPGEVLSCVGCHENRTASPPPVGLKLAFSRPASGIQPVADIPDVYDFPRDIQPILDRHCVSCHNPDKAAGGIALDGDRGPFYSHSYVALTVHHQFVDGRDLAKSNYPPYALGATPSPLMKKLDGAHHDVKLTALEQKKIRYWIESAAPYIGTYAGLGTGCIGGYALNEQRDNNDSAWPDSKKAAEAITRRCATCHQGNTRLPRTLSDETGVSFWRPEWNDPALPWSRHFLFNLTRPEKSMMLLGPLAKSAGGREVCKTILPDGKRGEAVAVFKDSNDPDYQAILALAEAGRRKLDEVKRFDMPGFRPRPEYLREMKRFGILPAAFDPAKDPVDSYQLDRQYWASLIPAPIPANAEKPGYGILSCDVDTYEITKYNAAGEPVWVYSQVRPIDAWPMPNGAVLVSYLPSPLTNNQGGVRLVGDAKQTIFDFPYNDEIMSCQPLPNGNILINECGAGRITEVDRKGTAVRGFEVKAKGKGHQTARFIRLTPQDTVLVGEAYVNKMREYDFTGAMLREWDVAMAYSASRLANGNTLVSGYQPATLTEFDPAGKAVWTLTAADLPPELNVGNFCESTRLANGNTLIACASRKANPGERVVLLEVTSDKKVVWKQMEPSRARETTSAKVLTSP